MLVPSYSGTLTLPSCPELRDEATHHSSHSVRVRLEPETLHLGALEETEEESRTVSRTAVLSQGTRLHYPVTAASRSFFVSNPPSKAGKSPFSPSCAQLTPVAFLKFQLLGCGPDQVH